MDPKAILQKSFLRGLPDAVTAGLLEGASEMRVAAGTIVHQSGDVPPVAIVAAGLARVFLAAADGRQVTVRYARPGDELGLATIVSRRRKVGVQALSTAEFLCLDASRVRAAVEANPAVAWRAVEELVALIDVAHDELVVNAFGTTRQRVARHLVDLAAGQVRPDGLAATITQQELARAVGSVREVVARVLRDLQDRGYVERAGGRTIRLVDVSGLCSLGPEEGESRGRSKRR
jgi:CRP/FNR family transcriptional regulator, cyclic AMP receptor protein